MYGVPYASVTPKMRSDAKSFNFGIPYGMGFRSLAILLTGRCGVSEVEEAKEKYELYFKDQPNVRTFFNKVKEMALVNKYTKTKWGV
jgi:DNA polymerase-1